MMFNPSVFICSINIIWVCFMQSGRQRKREKKLILSPNIPMNKQVEKRWFNIRRLTQFVLYKNNKNTNTSCRSEYESCKSLSFPFFKRGSKCVWLTHFSPNFKFSSLNKHYGDLLTHSTSFLLGSLRTKNGVTKRVDKQMMQVIHTPNQIIIYVYIC